MASIGDVECDMVKGNIRVLKERVKLWQVPGIDGYGSHLLGYGDSESQFRAIKYDSEANVENWSGEIETLQGTVVTITNDWGAVYPNCLITNVGMPVKKAIIAEAGDCRGEIIIDAVVTQ